MSPPPSVALVLLALWVLVTFGATNAAGYYQWLAKDDLESFGVPGSDDGSGDPRTARDAVAQPSDD